MKLTEKSTKILYSLLRELSSMRNLVVLTIVFSALSVTLTTLATFGDHAAIITFVLVVAAALFGLVSFTSFTTMVVKYNLKGFNQDLGDISKKTESIRTENKEIKKIVRSRADQLLYELRQGFDYTYAQVESKDVIDVLLKPDHPISGLSGWALTPDTGLMLVEIIKEEKPEVFLDLGSGMSTVLAAYAMRQNGKGKVISIDHDKKFFQKTKKLISVHGLREWVDLYHTPLKSQKVGKDNFQWYDLKKVPLENIDLVLVDGPPQQTQELARYPAVPLLYKKLNKGAAVILDDYGRDDEKRSVQRWLDEHSGLELTVAYTKKRAAILRKAK